MEGEKKEIVITLPTDVYFMSGIRDFTLTLLRNMSGMNDQWAYRFQSVVDELCNNAIEHGSAPGANITVRFIITANTQVEVAVDDTGTGKSEMKAEDIAAHVREAKAAAGSPLQNVGLRGRGLAQIVSNWTSELLFEDLPEGGVRSRAIKNVEEISAEPVKTGFMSSASVSTPPAPNA